jgi:deoxyribodipyrimidine photo-lyase
MSSASVFVFRRDLRLNDNLALLKCVEDAKADGSTVYPIFIFDPAQAKPSLNKYFTQRGFWYMIGALIHLRETIPLVCLYGNCVDMIVEIVKKLSEKRRVRLYFNKDYTSYSQKRDNAIIERVRDEVGPDIVFADGNDVVLGEWVFERPWGVFTAYHRFAEGHKVPKPIRAVMGKVQFDRITNAIKGLKAVDLTEYRKRIEKGIDLENLFGVDLVGEGPAIARLKSPISGYAKGRDNLSYKTSGLSVAIKFGCVSCRAVYWAHGNSEFRKQLHWRDFYINVAYFKPWVLEDNGKPGWNEGKYAIPKSIRPTVSYWNNNKKWFIRWCNGETGIDVVDAAMTELNKTGFMHNRGRLIVSNFLIRLLRIDWRHGEQYFATHLIDYDPSNNGLNWQFHAPGGLNANWFRIYNPETQREDHDPDRKYVKKWLGDRTPGKVYFDYNKLRAWSLSKK